MMISSFRQGLKEKESGQAIILGAVSLLVLAVGIMTTAQLGWAIKERIQLQHAADNAAYSTATMVARSLNFIAWTNRAMVSQYVTAMALQSYVTYFDGLNMLVAAAAASVLSGSFVLGVAGRILQLIPFTSPVGTAMIELAKVIGKGGNAIEKVANTLQKAIGYLDQYVVAPLVNIIGYFNEYVSYWLMQQILGRGYMYANFVNAGLGGTGFYRQAMDGTALTPKERAAGKTINDGTSGGIYDGVSNLIGGVGYESLFNSYSNKVGKDTSGEDEVRRAEKLMSQIINASREGRSGITWESKRHFGIGDVLGSIISLIGGGGSLDGAQKVFDFLSNLFAQSQGGTLIGGVVDKEHVGTHKEGNVKSYMKKSPVFNKNMYHGLHKYAEGKSIISQQYIRPPGGNVGGLIGRALNIFSLGGETIPVDKLVGIQATKDVNQRSHCHFSNIGAFNISLDSMSGQCDDVCSSSAKQCEENCSESCPDPVLDENGNPTDECKVSTVWTTKPGVTLDPEVDGSCDKCGESQVDEDNDCEAAKQCRDAMKEASEAAKEASDAANNAASEASEGLFGGRPAQVFVDCSCEATHRFSGITPYVSFDINKYHENQKAHKEVYPTFLAAAHKMPSFMEKGALGFGDNYTEGNNFKMTSIGVVEGVGAAPVGECGDGLGFSCNTDGYNYNHMNNGESVLLGLDVAGLHAWARSQVYYHRTGTWAEPPNLFNPYWKPKLSPIAPLVTNSVENFGSNFGKIGEFLGGLAEDVVDTVVSH